MPTFDCFALSDAGRDPDGNEDSCVLDENAGVFVIADGVGGRPGGARASRVTTETFVEVLRNAPPSRRLEETTLHDAVVRVNDAVLRVGAAEEDVRGLASTLSAVVVGEGNAKVVHVGDSRVYRLSNGSIEQLTRDHTVAAEMEAEGVRSTIGRRFQSMLSRAIGSAETVNPDVREVTLASGDALLLVTDGVTKTLAVDELRSLASEVETSGARAMCDRILRAAIAKEAKDNVTVAVVRVS